MARDRNGLGAAAIGSADDSRGHVADPIGSGAAAIGHDRGSKGLGYDSMGDRNGKEGSRPG